MMLRRRELTAAQLHAAPVLDNERPGRAERDGALKYVDLTPEERRACRVAVIDALNAGYNCGHFGAPKIRLRGRMYLVFGEHLPRERRVRIDRLRALGAS
jgi:hypothetical protein